MNYDYLKDLITRIKEKILINQFMNSKKGFTKMTPLFIRNNIFYQKIAITKDIDSIKYIDNCESLKEMIIQEAIRQKYVLKKESPSFLKQNYVIAKTSIYKDINSSNYVDWENLIYYQNLNVSSLINYLIDNGFILSSDSEETYLAYDERIVWSSIKKDINSFAYVNNSFLNNQKIFEYLVLNNYQFDSDISLVLQKNLTYFQNKDVVKIILKQLNDYLDKDNITRENFNSFLADFLVTRPLIKNFKEVFMVIGERCWDKYRKNHLEIFSNLFLKICSALRDEKGFDNAYGKLFFLNQMELILGDNYQKLFSAMREFHQIYHSRLSNKKKLIETSRNEISGLCSLYISKSKNNYLKRIEGECNNLLRHYFVINYNNETLKKEVLYKKKRTLFLNLYMEHDKNIYSFLNELIMKYEKEINRDILVLLISDFIKYNYSKLREIVLLDNNYDEYERGKKALKVFHRLQKGYISYDSKEALNYHDLIKFDEKNNCFLYNMKTFTKEEIAKFEKYNKIFIIFDKIKKSIVEKINSLDVKINYPYDFGFLEEQVPFTDEYFHFDENYLKNIMLEDIINNELFIESLSFDSFNDSDSLNNLYSTFINKNILWLMFMIDNNSKKTLKVAMFNNIDRNFWVKIINHMPKIIEFSKIINIDIKNIKNLFLMNEIVDNCKVEDLLVLGPNNIFSLCKNDDFTTGFHDDIIKMSRELILQMTKRNKSTVPYINGNYLDYHYSMYDSQDGSILFSGIKTDSCFRINGNDNDFMHYCALDKNGFIIKITNKNNELIARASGFRNGNCVFINQLRTIYDHFGNNDSCEYHDEKKELIMAFKKACDDIINISQNNCLEKDKIDFVFVNKSYILEDYNVGFVVSDEINFQIGDSPMDNTSEDWESFMSKTKNILDTGMESFFETDYGMYPIILVSRNNKKRLTIDNMIYQNVPAVYVRQRNRVAVSTKASNDLKRKINKIFSSWCFFHDRKFSPIYISDDSTIILGDNWFIIYGDNNIINSCVLDFDEDAIKEYTEIKKIILQSKNDEKDIIKKLSYKK